MKEIKNAKEFKKIIMDLEEINLKDEDCEMITGYFEGHDYEIKTDENNLFIVDVSDETDVLKANFEEIVERVYEWNNQLIEDTEREFIELLDYIIEPQKDLKRLNELFKYLLILKIDSVKLNNLEVTLKYK